MSLIDRLPKKEELKKLNCSLRQSHGYKGQKYEIRYEEDGVEKVLGWQDKPEGGMIKAIQAHPVWRNPKAYAVSEEIREAYWRDHETA